MYALNARERRVGRGYTLVELVLSMAFLGVFSVAIIRVSMAFFESMMKPEVVYSGETYALIPDQEEMDKAIMMFADWHDAVTSSNHVVVLGGNKAEGTIPTIPPPLVMGVSSGTLLQTVMSVRSASSVNVQNSADFYSAYNFTLSPLAESTYTNNDFTVLAVRGRTINAIIQCRRVATNADLGNGAESVVLYKVSLSMAGATQVYRCYLRGGEDTWNLPVGATHYWYRNDTVWDRREESGALLVFPDPSALSGRAASTLTSAAFSRLTYYEQFAR